MASDSKLPIVIFGALVALIAIPFLVAHLREQRRPLLIEARVVTATATDPVFREGGRRVPAGESSNYMAAGMAAEAWSLPEARSHAAPHSGQRTRGFALIA